MSRTGLGEEEDLDLENFPKQSATTSIMKRFVINMLSLIETHTDEKKIN